MGDTLTLMRRRRLLWNFALVLVFLGAACVTLVALVLRVPSFYKQADTPAGEARQLASRQALSQYSSILSSFGRDDKWAVEFTAEDLNAYFQEDFLLHGSDENLPAGFSEPRVKIEDGRIRVGVRYRNGLISTVLSIELKIWLIPSDTNLMAMEVVSLQAGSLPLSPSTLLDYISEAARRQNIDVSWYRSSEGHPVAVMRFQAELTRPTWQFERVELTPGKLTIAGRTPGLAELEPVVPPK